MKLRDTLRRPLISITLALGLLISPAIPATTAVFADGGNDCTPPAASSTFHWPTGADSGTFTYQCDGQYAGDWTNQYYVLDSSSLARTPLYDPAYGYDCAAGKWMMTYWSYSPAQGKFYSSRVTADITPNLDTGCPAAAPTTSDPNSPSQSISNTGQGSTNTSSSDTTLSGSMTNNNTLNATNNLNSASATGGISLIGNTIAGSAGTGDAMTIANIANLLQSTGNALSPDTLQFTANIDGDVNGDFMFDPSALLNNTGADSTNTASNDLQVNTDNTNNTNAQITNNINVGATSGSANVSGNTEAGDVSTGNADAIVNLMNLINSTVAAGHSFVGTVNINGDLNGDILLPQNFIDQLLASTGQNSTNSADNTATSTSTTTNNTNENINNNLNSSAQSGSANVDGNTGTGNITTGQATSGVTLLNLTGSSVVGSNDLLVFVNVLGHWVGMIVNAPTGATAASLGGGITGTGNNSTNSTSNDLSSTDTTTNNANLGITNNVTAHAQSGDANVNGNTGVGDVTTGDARTAVNILNMTGSNLSLSNWFGILFINVFGNWTGSFGVNTSAGDPVSGGTSNSSSASTASSNKPQFQFVPRSTVPGASNRDYNVSATSSTGSGSTSGSVLASHTIKNSAKLPGVSTISPAEKTINHLFLPVIGAAFAFAILFAGERKSRTSHRTQV